MDLMFVAEGIFWVLVFALVVTACFLFRMDGVSFITVLPARVMMWLESGGFCGDARAWIERFNANASTQKR